MVPFSFLKTGHAVQNVLKRTSKFDPLMSQSTRGADMKLGEKNKETVPSQSNRMKGGGAGQRRFIYCKEAMLK